MIFLHLFHVCRLVYKVIASLMKRKTILGGIIKCLLMDCYCSCAGFIYIYVQFAYFLNWKKCLKPSTVDWALNKYLILGRNTYEDAYTEEERKDFEYLTWTTQWLWWEILYQWAQILIYLFTNLVIVLIILNQQKRLQKDWNETKRKIKKPKRKKKRS
jgi:hypothetical protein